MMMCKMSVAGLGAGMLFSIVDAVTLTALNGALSAAPPAAPVVNRPEVRFPPGPYSADIEGATLKLINAAVAFEQISTIEWNSQDDYYTEAREIHSALMPFNFEYGPTTNFFNYNQAIVDVAQAAHACKVQAGRMSQEDADAYQTKVGGIVDHGNRLHPNWIPTFPYQSQEFFEVITTFQHNTEQLHFLYDEVERSDKSYESRLGIWNRAAELSRARLPYDDLTVTERELYNTAVIALNKAVIRLKNACGRLSQGEFTRQDKSLDALSPGGPKVDPDDEFYAVTVQKLISGLRQSAVNFRAVAQQGGEPRQIYGKARRIGWTYANIFTHWVEDDFTAYNNAVIDLTAAMHACKVAAHTMNQDDATNLEIEARASVDNSSCMPVPCYFDHPSLPEEYVEDAQQFLAREENTFQRVIDECNRAGQADEDLKRSLQRIQTPDITHWTADMINRYNSAVIDWQAAFDQWKV